MSCDVVLRADKGHASPDRCTCEVTVFVRDNVVRVVAAAQDLEIAIDDAASKVTRQLRKYKTRVVDKRQRSKKPVPDIEKVADLGDLIEVPDVAPKEEETDELVREKIIEFTPMTVEEALVQTDLIGHDFYVFENSVTGLVNVVYRRKNGGYGIIMPKIEEVDE
jgi:putative sigma-54 modulation protein